jgi:uroporphyrinogen-III synthase
LTEALAEAAYEIRTCVLYEIVEEPELPDAARDALRSDMLDAVLIYSPRSARLFADRVKRADLVSFCARTVACCISRKAVEALKDIPFAEIGIATHPDQPSLLALLE